jgi:hypothetical protein
MSLPTKEDVWGKIIFAVIFTVAFAWMAYHLAR